MLKINNISFSYSDGQVLHNISATFQAKRIHGVLGANGAGKTTLFQLIYGILAPSSGTIRFQDNRISPSQIGYLEAENYFYPYMKGQEYLDLLCHDSPEFNIDLWNKVFNLPLDELIDTYSTGMKKKLALFGIISLDRPVLLLDEPFRGLDLEAVENLNYILKKLKKTDKIIIITSHILPVLTKNCDQISFLHQGRVQQTFKKPAFNQIGKVIRRNLLQRSEPIFHEIFDG